MKMIKNKKLLVAVLIVAVVAIIAAVVLVMIPIMEEAKIKAQERAEIQAAQDACSNYMETNSDKLEQPKLFLYEVAEGKVIAVKKGEPIGTYATQEDVLVALIGEDYDTYELKSTENEKLFTYGEEVPLFSNYTANPYAGKTISILGDSISTYIDVSNNTDYNSTIGANAVYYGQKNTDVTQSETWWQQVIDVLDMKLCVNNSWSGSYVLQERNDTKGAYVSRCEQLHNDNTGEEPDVIVVFMGTNDYSYYQDTLGTADLDYDALLQPDAEPSTACEAYAIMLHKISVRYPDAEVYCLGLLPRRVPDLDGKDVVPAPTEFNAELKKIIEHFDYTMVDLENCGVTEKWRVFDKYITDRRVHPGELGMDLITNALLKAMVGEE